ncbi:MAG: 30S ribosomal protein S3 [Candidatus Hydrothermarchaeaceae archaeon]
MAIERKFIADNFRKLEVKEFLEKGLDRAGCGEIDIQRTPQGTRVIVYAQRPGLVIGRKGGSIRKSTNILKTNYHIDNPQIEVNELEISELNAKVMAKSITSAIERGIHFRRAAYTALRRIMEAGARGVEIKVSGKLTGDRSKTVKFTDGSMKHCGEPALIYVEKGQATASPKPGITGVTVKIIPPGVKLPDEIVFLDREKIEEDKKAKEAKLVEDIQEEIAVVHESKAVSKTIKPEKVKRKSKKKVEEEKEEKAKKVEGDKEAEVPKKAKAPEKPATKPKAAKAVKKKAEPKSKPAKEVKKRGNTKK